MTGDDETDDTVETLKDTADRFERTIDHQIQIINEIDSKAEHITRLLGVLIGAILSVVAVALRINEGELNPPNTPLLLHFIIGIALLLFSMLASIITYLSSRFKIGIHYRPANLLSQTDYEIDSETHYRRVIGTYGYNLEKNKKVIETNSARFRLSLVSIFAGVLFLSGAGLALISDVGKDIAWVMLLIECLILGIIGIYVLTGSYLTLEDQS